MFNNLIESSSHAKEFKRRGSFLLFTTATYLVLFIVTGVVSIYAYDAHLEEQNLEIVVLLPPQEIVPDAPPDTTTPASRDRQHQDDANIPQREIAMLGINHPDVVPERISATPSKNLPLPEGGIVHIGGPDRTVVGTPGGPGAISGGRQISTSPRVVIDDEPPPVPESKPVVPAIVRRSVILNSEAIYLPKPSYPALARNIRLQGTVAVQVLIDESGKVISAKAVSGHPMLVAEAQRAASQARFSPTKINGQPVKISGVISYNFVMQN
ncbi:MAG: hypothetical protein DMF69_20485 [Acidobacteria bacterium]|nr:MAG: hypothetical protein DMF69_20485 [Acidobacteriota bacterium]